MARLGVALLLSVAASFCASFSRAGVADEPPAAAETSFSLEEVRSYDSGGSVFSLSFTQDGHTVLLGGDTPQKNIKLWDAATGQPVRTLDAIVGLVVACAPDQPRAAVADGGDKARLYSLEGGKPIREFPHNAFVTALAFSPDGRRLAIAGADKVACVWDVETAKELLRLKGHEGSVTDVLFSPDGRRLITASEDKTVRVWDAGSGALLRELPHKSRVWRVAISPDGRRLLTGTGGPMIGSRTRMDVVAVKDNGVRLWDLESGQLLREMPGHENAVRALAFHPRLPLAASGGLDKTLVFWNVETGAELCRVKHGGWVSSLAFSPDGEYLLSGGGSYKKDLNWIKVRDQRLRQFRVIPAPAGANAKIQDATGKEETDEAEAGADASEEE